MLSVCQYFKKHFVLLTYKYKYAIIRTLFFIIERSRIHYVG